jgi:hypothetical protein
VYTRSTSIFIYLNLAKQLSLLLDKYDIICADKVLSYEHVLYNQSKQNLSMLMISVYILYNKICPILAQGMCIYVDHSFFHETQLDQLTRLRVTVTLATQVLVGIRCGF